MKQTVTRWLTLGVLVASTFVLVAGCASTTGNKVAGSNQPGGETAQMPAAQSPAAQSPAAQSPAAPSSAALAGTWLGSLDTGEQKIRIVFHLSGANDALTATLDSPDQGATGIGVSSATFDGDQLTLDISVAHAVFVGTVAADGASIDGTWKQGAGSLPLSLVRADGAAVNARPQDPVAPYPYTSRDVTFKSDAGGITIAGTLTIPSGKGPFPAAVLITGSGPQNRNEELFNHRPFLVIADYLTRRGIAVLRCDDRGMGGTGGSLETTTEQDLTIDAISEVKFLASQPSIDPKRVGVIGHSEGGLLGPMVAAKYPSLAFVVMLAGPGYDGYDILLQQSEAILRASGATDEQVAAAQKANRSIYDIIRAEPDNAIATEKLTSLLTSMGVPNDKIKPEIDAMLSPWYRSFLNSDPTPALEHVACPLLAIGGSKDVQVPAEKNLAAIEKAVRAGGNNDVQTIEFPGLNHLFQHATTGMPQEYGEIAETFAPEVLKAMGDWIVSKTM